MFSAFRASPPGAVRDQLDELVRHVGAELRGAPPDDRRELLVRERHELVDLAPREQGRVDLEVRVLGRRADQRHRPLLDRRQERVLLRLVEPVDLVQEEDRPLALRAEPLPAGLSTSRTWATVADTAESSSKAAPVVFAITLASVVLPLPGGP